MSGAKERANAITEAEALGWTAVLPPGKKGYIKLKCACGRHVQWLHKTPSNPNYFREKIRHLRRTCAREG